MSEQVTKIQGLPDNAYTELKPGEEYIPIMLSGKEYPEVNSWSVSWGLVMAALFSAAAAYLGLKIGQVFEAAIPIAIMAVGISKAASRKGALGENVIIQSIGSTSGAVVAGGIFTLPAMYILNLNASFIQMFLATLLGGFLGILFLVPFRKYFVSEMHGKLPFPEGTATTEILVTGEKGGNQAKVLVLAGLLGGLFDFVTDAFGLWGEKFTSAVVPIGDKIAEKAKMIFKIDVHAAILGLGYIIGLRYSVIIVAGSFLSWFVLIPLIAYLGDYITLPIGNTTLLIKEMSADQIFSNYVRHIGIGGIAMAGFIGILRSSKIIKSAVSLAAKEFTGSKTSDSETVRTQRDLPMKIIAIGLFAVAIVIFVFFMFGVVHNLVQALIGLLVVMVISFLFTTVAANAIAITGNNPVSGMTLMTLILSSIILLSAGLSGTTGMLSALLIGGVVCTALSMAGSFVTDLKIGYWLGSSPYKQQTWKFLGTIVAAAVVVLIMQLMNDSFGFVGEKAIAAPQANAMVAVIQPIMSNQPVPWILYIAGACIALILTMLKVPVLAFALGMYLPQHLNTPLLVGGLIAHYVSTRSSDAKLNKARENKGTLIASGFIAGGALFGVLSMIIQSIMKSNNLGSLKLSEWADSNSAQILALVMFALLCLYIVWDSMRAKKEEE
jgi:putative OPT family oligopeptide transporter